ncbi:Nucleoside_ribosyltransferase / Purine nucleoside phosphorylase [Hexamita inflata]|uniref:purine-nucleoside phosphorylase n=1 Tax=Hexamita inflata TaxID=28002 RepID=A0AA86R4S1_9EUKA|nr:Nucleoside ribosyltransferase / Purine nucleoside phosphorylase [Hexamita inflata]
MPYYSEYKKDIQKAADYILSHMGAKPQIAIILGSGLSSYADTAFTDRKEINYADIPNLPVTTVSGHRGKLYYGHIQGKLSVCFAGRFHSYEGHAGPIITLLPQLAHALGCSIYILTNAAGGTLPGMQTGCLMSIKDHATTSRFNSLYGFEAINCSHEVLDHASFQEKIQHLSYPFTTSSQEIYSNELNKLAHDISVNPEFVTKTSFQLHGQNRTVQLHESTYMFNSGPNYESHSEIRKLVQLCPGSVGMSSVPEALAARMFGMQVYGMSLITNLGAGLSDEVLTHEDVKEVADKVSGAVQELVGQLIKEVHIDKLQHLKPWGEVKEDFEMVQKQTGFCSWAEAETLSKKFNAKRCVVYPDCKFELYQSGEILFVSSPKTLNQHQASLVLAVCQLLNISDIKVAEKHLPKNTVISSTNVINQTGLHLTVKPVGTPLARVAGKQLVIVDSCEDPMTNIYIQNYMKEYKLDFCSNQNSALYALIGRQVGVEVLYSSVDQLNAPVQNKVPAKWEMSSFVPAFGVFNVEQVHFKHAQELYEKVFKSLDVQKCVIIDSVNAKFCGTKLDTPFEAYYCAEHKCLKMKFDQLQENKGLCESALPARILKFINPAETMIITDNSPVKQTTIVKDVLNISGLNTLRGENDEKFGARFPDLSQICDQTISKRLGYEQKVFMLQLDQMYECNIPETVFGGCLQNLITLVHQKTKVCAVVTSSDKLEEVIKKFIKE